MMNTSHHIESILSINRKSIFTGKSYKDADKIGINNAAPQSNSAESATKAQTFKINDTLADATDRPWTLRTDPEPRPTVELVHI